MLENFIYKLVFPIIKIICGGAVLFVVFYFSFKSFKEWDYQKTLPAAPFVDDGVCNVVTIPISGMIGVAATDAQADQSGNTISDIPFTGDVDRVMHDLDYVKSYPGIDAVILQIDSAGGEGNADQVLLSYLKNYPKPVVSLIRDVGASMGYSVSLGSKRIFAYPDSTVGSIGVTSSYLSSADKDEKDGLKYISIASGKFKDTGNPDKKLSDEELKYLKEQNQNYFERFVDLVANYRNLPKDKVESLADGRVWLSDQAKDLGLIDQVGDKDDALNWIENYLNASSTGKRAIPCAQY